MILKDLSFVSPQENILYDDVLLQLAEAGECDEILRFWESPSYFIVLGRTGKEKDDLRTENVIHDRISVLRRSSGGGTVVQGKGCLNYSLILSKEKTPEIADLRKSYIYILQKIVLALSKLGKECAFLPISDIALLDGEKKISGNAQKRGRRCILHHGTLLYDFDLHKIEHYLNMPKDIPAYRTQRKHLDFVANLHVSSDAIKKEIVQMFQINQADDSLHHTEKEILSNLYKRKSTEVQFSQEI